MNLSVIIPCFNAEKTLGRQLEALASQAYSDPWELIISDNGSSDRSLEIVEHYRSRLPHLRLVDASAKPGAAYSRNVGAAVATGSKLLFLDADDEAAPGWLKAMSAALSQHRFVAGRLSPERVNSKWLAKARTCPQMNGLQQRRYLPNAAACNLGIDRAIFDSVKGFDETIQALEDTDFCWRVQLSGTKLHFVREALVYYRFRHRTRDIYCQAFRYGEASVYLHQKYRPLGKTEPPSSIGFQTWIAILKRLRHINSRTDWASWVQYFGWHVGMLRGCFRYGVWFL